MTTFVMIAVAFVVLTLLAMARFEYRNGWDDRALESLLTQNDSECDTLILELEDLWRANELEEYHNSERTKTIRLPSGW